MLLDLPNTAAYSPAPSLLEPTGRRGARLPSRSSYTTSGTFDAGDVTFTAVPGSSVEASVIYHHSNLDDPVGTYLADVLEHQRAQAQVRIAVVQRLQEVVCDAESSGAPISQSSIRDFRDFIAKASPARRPSIFLLDNGNIRALWVNEKKEQVGLQFLGDGVVQFVIFVQRPAMMARDHGTESLSAMFARMGSNGVAHLLA